MHQGLKLVEPPRLAQQITDDVRDIYQDLPRRAQMEAPTLLKDLHWTPLEGPGIYIYMSYVICRTKNHRGGSVARI